MMRFLFLRVILPLLIFWLIRGLLKSIMAANRSSVAHSPKQTPSRAATGELKKDPVCGTFVPAEGSITTSVNGETLHFCSIACRDKFRAA